MNKFINLYETKVLLNSQSKEFSEQHNIRTVNAMVIDNSTL